MSAGDSHMPKRQQSARRSSIPSLPHSPLSSAAQLFSGPSLSSDDQTSSYGYLRTSQPIEAIMASHNAYTMRLGTPERPSKCNNTSLRSTRFATPAAPSTKSIGQRRLLFGLPRAGVGPRSSDSGEDSDDGLGLSMPTSTTAPSPYTRSVVAKSLDGRPSFLTPRLVKPDSSAFNSSGLLSKKKVHPIVTNAMSKVVPATPDPRIIMPDTPCKRTPSKLLTDILPPSGAEPLLLASTPVVRRPLKHRLSLSDDQCHDMKRLHVDAEVEESVPIDKCDATSPFMMECSPIQSTGDNSHQRSTRLVRSSHRPDLASPVRFQVPRPLAQPHAPGAPSSIRRAPPPSVMVPETPVPSARRSTLRLGISMDTLLPRPPILRFDKAPETPIRMNRQTNLNTSIPSPNQFFDSDDEVTDDNASVLLCDAEETPLTTRTTTAAVTTITKGLIYSLEAARVNDSNEGDVLSELTKVARERTLVYNGYMTVFAHFLRPAYFSQLKHDASREFVLPEDTLLLSSTSDYPDYFETNFTVERTLGSGEFSEAFAARFKEDGCLYAVKRRKFPYVGVRDRLRQLEEVEILWQIDQHPHCIRLVNAWEQMGHLYLQMELCSGGSLKEHMDAHCISDQLAETQIWKLFADMLAGLKHIHELGILHLDLKPANILLDNNERLKIGDFGLAVIEPLPDDPEREGDREYIAPEILDGEYGRPADIFSLGLIVLEMAANVVLPDNGLPWRKLRNGNLSDCDFTGISESLVTFIRRMLNPVPSKRPTVDELLTEMRTVRRS